MQENNETIDFSDIPEITDFSNAIKNPFAGHFKEGYHFIVHHDSPDGGWDEEKFIKPEDMAAEIEKDIERYSREKALSFQ
jgi:hypothetical protein